MKNDKKKIPIGIVDFKDLIDQEYYYVDKTLLIRDVLESGKVLLLPRPRRFGKTLNISMLRYFFEKSDQPKTYLFTNTAIWQHDAYRILQGQFPVIYVTFKEIEELTWEVAYDKFAIVLYKEFDRHKYLLESNLESYEREFFLRIIERRASLAELETSLQFLAGLLYTHYKKKPYVLIDEYDVPIQAAYLHGYYPEAIHFLKKLLSAVLKDGNEIEKGILTGILTLAKAGIFTGLNNLDIYNLTDLRISDKFGFTQDEVHKLLCHYGLEAHQETVAKWYDGYTFGTQNNLFNPWSVLSCIKNAAMFKPYWANSSNNELVKQLIGCASISTKTDLESLLSGVNVTQQIEESFTLPDLAHRSDLLWSLLLFTGYVTYSQHRINNKGKVECELKIPNAEIASLYSELITQIVQDSIVGGQVKNLLEALITGDTEILTKLLQSFVINTMSCFDIASDEPEKSYHMFVLGLLVLLQDTYEVKSNKESGLGRYDILLIPRKKNQTGQTGIVIEFKVVRKGETLESAAAKALMQVSERKYIQELQDRQVNSIIAYGIAFEGKQLFIKKL
jgi:hypothetical protein